MSSVSVFDIFKIGVGPSSSHTLGPWRAAERFVDELEHTGLFARVDRVKTDLYGSLAKTGHGHGTDLAVLMGLAGQDPTLCASGALPAQANHVRAVGTIKLDNHREIAMSMDDDVVFHRDQSLPFHPNGLRFTAYAGSEILLQETYFSVGGGFVVKEGEESNDAAASDLPHRIDHADELETLCERLGKTIAEIVNENELAHRTQAEIDGRLDLLVEVMRTCVFDGCHTEGQLPGGLNVKRRAAGIARSLLGGEPSALMEEWLEQVKDTPSDFDDVLQWVSCFALAVNEQNAAYGRVVTAPTNGAAGVIPAVMMFLDFFCRHVDPRKALHDYLLTAAQVGMLFKAHATISAAMGGCQAEIGVSSAMAAAGLAAARGASPAQALMAAEIAMEHHLGLTCDPVGGLVQIPCIERNTMGAVKAITAAQIAAASDPKAAKVSLDQVIDTMWTTALDMSSKYKETSEGGLAVQIPLSLPEC